MAKRYWNSKSYGIFSTTREEEAEALEFWFLKQSTIDFLKEPEVGNWLQTHFARDPICPISPPLPSAVATTKSAACFTRSSGKITRLAAVTTTEACRYSIFDFSSSVATPSPVYILTFQII